MSLFTQLPELNRIKCIFRKYGFQPLATQTLQSWNGIVGTMGVSFKEVNDHQQHEEHSWGSHPPVSVPQGCLGLIGCFCWHFSWRVCQVFSLCLQMYFSVSWVRVKGKNLHHQSQQIGHAGWPQCTANPGVVPADSSSHYRSDMYKRYIIVLFGDRKFSQALWNCLLGSDRVILSLWSWGTLFVLVEMELMALVSTEWKLGCSTAGASYSRFDHVMLLMYSKMSNLYCLFIHSPLTLSKYWLPVNCLALGRRYK